VPTNGLLPPDVGEIHGEADDGEEEVQVAAPRLPLSVFCSIISFRELARLKTPLVLQNQSFTEVAKLNTMQCSLK
jgi:hypothetical protein